MTIGEITSRLRNILKDQFGDSRYSNRYLWNVFLTASKYLIKQDADKSRIYNQTDLWQSICIKLEEVPTAICNCYCLLFDKTVYRSVDKLPKILESSDGLIYRFISSPDMSKQFTLVTPYQYQVKSRIKYNKELYVFTHDGYLYSPSVSYPLLVISAVFEDDVSHLSCGSQVTVSGSCGSILDTKISLPDYLIDAAIKMSLQELGASKAIVTDEAPNQNSTQTQGSP